MKYARGFSSCIKIALNPTSEASGSITKVLEKSGNASIGKVVMASCRN